VAAKCRWINRLGKFNRNRATTATYAPSSATPGTTYYRVLVNAANSGCDQAVSNNAVAVITADLVITTQPTDVNECIGGTNTMTVTVTGGSGTITYQWQQVQMVQLVGRIQQEQEQQQLLILHHVQYQEQHTTEFSSMQPTVVATRL
jgi:hypothetical protein